ncbi:hypothetical protein [Planctomyces sp. SH-PL14]|uniref:hypothetical protein n=1 Tax=Planctomyces sp. SH-PL14 TaxID=1632864 RepID=UPI00078EA160|nr:hypothetical protein [Planctomyces sp. SH-PL14]AMV21982.1 hypothetical protein VT03_29030 [Planctomyces sp. SH-PL14]
MITRSRRTEAVAAVALVLACWWGMQMVHEAGHVLAALVSGGRVVAVELRPWAISRTDVDPNPSPLLVVWGGPVVGVLVPLVAWSILRACRVAAAALVRFFAGFCCVANGVYIAVGGLSGIGDGADLLRHGASPWTLVVFGTVAVAVGLGLWNGQSRVLSGEGGVLRRMVLGVVLAALAIPVAGSIVTVL